jgi:hypothetical protein
MVGKDKVPIGGLTRISANLYHHIPGIKALRLIG